MVIVKVKLGTNSDRLSDTHRQHLIALDFTAVSLSAFRQSFLWLHNGTLG